MSPHNRDRSSSACPAGDGCSDVLEMVGPCRQAWKLGRGLDHRGSNAQSLPVKRHLLVALYQLVRLDPVQRGKLVRLLHNQPRRHLPFPGTVGDNLAHGRHACNSFASSLCHEDRRDETLLEAGGPAGSREQQHQP